MTSSPQGHHNRTAGTGAATIKIHFPVSSLTVWALRRLHQPPLKLRLLLARLHGRQTHWSGLSRRLGPWALLSPLTSRSSAPTNPQNQTPGDHSCLLLPFSAEPSLPFTGVELPPMAMAPRTCSWLEFSFQGPICKNQEPVCEESVFKPRSKTQNLKKCKLNLYVLLMTRGNFSRKKVCKRVSFWNFLKWSVWLDLK